MRAQSFIRISLLLLCLLNSMVTVAQYQINGAASQMSCNCFQLTPDAPNVGGSVWNVNQIDLTNPFDYSFQVFLGCDEWGADGIGFVLQPVNVNQGGPSSSLGYGGIVPSLIVEVDTWPNDQTMSDPQEDHIAILRNGDPNHGSVNNLAGPVTASSTQNNIEDCQWHLIRIVWSPSLNSFTVYFDGVFRTSYTGDIINNIFNGNPNVYWGWTGGTGSASADQRFCNAIFPVYTITSNSSCVGDQIVFQDASITSSGNITNYSWNFGDGSTGTGNPATHTYSTSGNFNVELTITTEGCTEDTIIPITIDPTPTVNLGPDLNICLGDNVQLNNPNNLGSGTYSWSPTTSLSSPSAPSPTSATTSTINYTLTYTSNNGCSGSDNVQVIVNPLPVANAGTDATICQNDQAQLQATGGVNYAWSPAGSLDDPTSATPNASPTTTTTYTVTVSDANNCTATDDVTVTVVPAPTVDAGQNQNICEGDMVQMNATGVGNFSWSPSAGLSSTTIANPNANPIVTTTYYVTLTDANNCSATDSVVVDVDPIPVADFPDPVPACDGNPVQFSENSTGNVVNYLWTFGDGQTGTGANPSHVYPAIGTYNVSLTVTSNNGCTSSTSGTAEVVNGPTPDFSVDNGPDICVGEELEIIDNSSGPIASYEWNFGDGNTSASTQPVQVYSTPGTYSVLLTLTAPDQCMNTQTVEIQVYPLPVADFSFTSACEGQSTGFTDHSTVATGSVVGWEWYFDDGSPIEYSSTLNHAYATTGSYNVMLISQTDEGCRDTVYHQVSVNPTPNVQITAADGCLGDETSFTNSTTPNNTIAMWEWQFGDGQVSNQFEPTHLYATADTFLVQLTATTDSGCAAVGSTQLSVYPYPEPAFSVSDIEGCTPMEISFTNESTIDGDYAIGSYQWIFGDGTSSTETSPNHIYVTDGQFDVSLVATTDIGGCSDTITLSSLLSIYLTPRASFTFRPTDASMLDPRIFFRNTSINAVDFYWDFGDENASTESDPMNAYPAEGDYLVTLVASNGICSSTTVRELHIDPETFLYIPNSFTPNGDGLNDGFIPKGIGIEDFKMTIFDRWGKELYYTNTMDQPWRGWFNGLELPIDTYVYRIEILDVKGEVRKFLGSVNLVR
ncbi:MAG: PKD domain-containing protein [Flavobacteriales bacterium]|nr:PKD domain-containing protein [Flavobacteriales bacterium]